MEPTTAATEAPAARTNRNLAARKAAARNANQGSGSELVSLLERIWVKVQGFATQYAGTELPPVHIVSGAGSNGSSVRLGSVLTNAWQIALREGRTPELFISGETLGMGPDHALVTILHEAAHVLLLVQGDPKMGCSRQMRYHNASFRDAGATFGLEWLHGRPNELRGFSALSLSDMGRVLWGAELEALGKVTATIPGLQLVPTKPEDPSDDRLTAVKPDAPVGTVRVQRRRIVVSCDCRRLSVFAEEADDLVCGKCRSDFTTR